MEHQITICTSCRHKGIGCRPGYELIERLRQAIAQAGDAIPEQFEISGIACMTGCDRACTVAYHGTRNATYMFGDVTPDADISELVVFARQYAHLHDDWWRAAGQHGQRPGSTPARMPAAIIAIETTETRAC